MKNTETVSQYSVAGKQVVCAHCGNQDFTSREILMNTRGATFMKLDWLNRSAIALTCGRCSRIEWFNEAPDESTPVQRADSN